MPENPDPGKRSGTTSPGFIEITSFSGIRWRLYQPWSSKKENPYTGFDGGSTWPGSKENISWSGFRGWYCRPGRGRQVKAPRAFTQDSRLMLVSDSCRPGGNTARKSGRRLPTFGFPSLKVGLVLHLPWPVEGNFNFCVCLFCLYQTKLNVTLSECA